MIKFKDIYAISGTPLSLTDWCLREGWFPELSNLMGNIGCILELLAAENRLVIKSLVDKNFDGERIALMRTIWFDGKPVAIVQNAGRSGYDHSARWITDLTAYTALLGYLMGHLVSTLEADDSGVVDPETEVYEEELLFFYGNDFSKELGFTREPQRKDVLLLQNERDILPGVPSTYVMAVLQKGAPEVPEYIRRVNAVFRKVRLVPTEELMERNSRIVEVNDMEGRDRVCLYEPCARPVGEFVQSV